MSSDSSANILEYEPNKIGAGITAAIYILLGLAFLFWPKRIISQRQYFYLVLPIGAVLTGIGWAVRIVYADNYALATYIVQELLIVVAPALFFAFNCSYSSRPLPRLQLIY